MRPDAVDTAAHAYQPLELRIGHRFADGALLRTALTHKSWVNEQADAARGDNERLEFLGDAVLALVVSDILMRRAPDRQEGDLSKARAAVISEAPLARCAEAVALGEWLFLGRGAEQSGGRHAPSILADAFEALLGAVYLDGGFVAVHRVAETLLSVPLDMAVRGTILDPKSTLQERAQAQGREDPRYLVVSEQGPDHDKIWEVEVIVSDVIRSRGTGHSKKEAEQAAAARALQDLGGEP